MGISWIYAVFVSWSFLNLFLSFDKFGRFLVIMPFILGLQ